VDEDYWDEIEDRQAELARDPDNRAGEPEAPPAEGGEGDDGGAEQTRGTGEEPGDGLSDALSGGEDGGEEQTEP
jgi:hypothetical protein